VLLWAALIVLVLIMWDLRRRLERIEEMQREPQRVIRDHRR